jgi:hypothetical protein
MPLRRDRTSVAESLSEVRAVYRELERRPVARDCVGRTDCCRFKLTGKTPYVTKGELLVLVDAVRASGRQRLAEPTDAQATCPLLSDDGRCSVYEARPFGCRTHFCRAAGGPIAREDVRDLVHRLDDVDSALGGDGGRALPEALRAMLRTV